MTTRGARCGAFKLYLHGNNVLAQGSNPLIEFAQWIVITNRGLCLHPWAAFAFGKPPRTREKENRLTSDSIVPNPPCWVLGHQVPTGFTLQATTAPR